MRRIMVLTAMVLAISGIAACSSRPGATVVSSRSGSSWDAYISKTYANYLTSAVWDGRRMVLVAFDNESGAFKDIVAAYDPGDGSWRDLPPLPTEIPVTVNAVVATRDGVIVSGLACDPAKSVDGGDGLKCLPGTIETFLMPTGTDRFIAIDAPGSGKAHSIPTLAQGGLSGAPYLWVDGVVYELSSERTWQAIGDSLVGDSICEVGNDLWAVRADQTKTPGRPPVERLIELRDGSHKWTVVDLPSEGSYGALHCGGGHAALFELTNEEPPVNSMFLLQGDRAPASVAGPGDLLGTITFDGRSFVTSGSVVRAGESPNSAPRTAYAVDSKTAKLGAIDRHLEPGESMEAYPLDGTMALFLTSAAVEGRDPEVTYTVERVVSG